MVSFLDKLKVKIEEDSPGTGGEDQDKKEKKRTGFLQLEVDVYQTSTDIFIITNIPGVETDNLDISIENENDVITIQGKREVPEIDDIRQVIKNAKALRQENQWGQFYRQIILPQEVNVAEVEAKFKKGILVLKLPLLRIQTRGRKKILIENNEEETKKE